MNVKTQAGTRRIMEVRPWGDIARKLIAAVLGGITGSGIVWLLAIFGIAMDPGYAGLIATLVAGLAGYFVPGTVPARAVRRDKTD